MTGIATLGTRTINKLIAPLGVGLVRNTPKRYPKTERPKQPRFLNIGAGKWRHPNWHNLDYMSDWYERSLQGNVDINHDLMSRDKFPVEDATLEVAYTSHTIEHIRNEDAQFMFDEVYRILAPGGVFRITCPNINLAYDAYQRDDLDYFYWNIHYPAATIGQRLLEHFASALLNPNSTTQKFTDEEIAKVFKDLPKEEALDFFTSHVTVSTQQQTPGNHMNWFNPTKIEAMLREAGFSDIWESAYMQSKSPSLRLKGLFDTTHPGFSLYMECYR